MGTIIFKSHLSGGELKEVERIVAKNGQHTEKELNFVLAMAARNRRVLIRMDKKKASIEKIKIVR
jgi:hypothetical protein